RGIRLVLDSDIVTSSEGANPGAEAALGFKSIEREERAIVFPLEQGTLKVFTQLEEGIDQDVEMRLFLTRKTPFRNFLPLYGYVEYEGPGKKLLVLAEQVILHRLEYSAKKDFVEAADHFLQRIEALKEPERAEIQLPVDSLVTLARGELDPK